MPVIASVADYVAAMRRCELPEARGWDDLARAAPDAETLARELARAGFLTLFQSRQLLTGRGDDLVVGSFLLIEQVGAGGMGQVFKAKHRLMGRTVALKVMLPALGEDEDVVARFRQEVQSVARLSHPNIVTAYHADSGPRGLILAMEYCDGSDLGRAVREGGPLAVARACACIGQAASGLSAAHAAGLVHRDIKPSNLLLTADGVVKVLDFGLARFFEGDDTDRLTRTGASMGTPDFMAPEQARDSAAVDIRGDIYSLGCTLYYLLTGRVPFPGGTPWYKISRHQNDEPEPIEALRPQVSSELAAVVRRMMAKDPLARYQTPGDVVRALAPFHSVTAPTVVAVGEPPLTRVVIPVGAELPRVVAEASGTIPVAVRESSPFDFADTPAPVSDPSTATRLATTGPTRAPEPPAPRPRWPRWVGAVAGALLVACVIGAVLMSRGRVPDTATKAPDAQSPPPLDLPKVTIPAPKPPDAAKVVDPPRVLDLPPFVRADGADFRIGVHRIAFHPKKPELLAVARGQGWNPVHGGVEVWDVLAQKRVRAFGGEQHPPVFAVAFSGDGQYLAFADGSPKVGVSRAKVTVVSTDTWEQRCQFATDSDGVLALAFTHGTHTHLVIGTQVVYEKGPPTGGFEVWSSGGDWKAPRRVVDPNRDRARVDQPGPVTGIAMHPHGVNNFATVGRDASARLWQAETQRDQTRIVLRGDYPSPMGGNGPITDLVWTPNGQMLGAVTARSGADREDAQVLAWGSPASVQISRIVTSRGSAYDFNALAFLPSSAGPGLVTGGGEGRLRVWNLPSVTERPLARDFKLFEREIHALAVSPDGRTLAVAGEAVGTNYQIHFIPTTELGGR